MKLSLLFLNGPDQGKQVRLSEFPVTIGRSSEADIVLPWDGGLSGADKKSKRKGHCAIFQKEKFFYIQDLGSTAGTVIDERNIGNEDGEVRLMNEMIIRLHKILFKVLIEE